MIRPAEPRDAGAICDCIAAAFARYVPVIGRRPAPMDADPLPAIEAGMAEVACDAGRVIGVAIFRPDAGFMQLDTIAVHPERAGRGYGRALIARCEDRAREGGLAGVTLYTNAAMTANLTFYPALGYRQVGRRIQNGFDRVYFEKP